MKNKLRALVYLALVVGYIAGTAAVLSPTQANTPPTVVPSKEPAVGGPFYATAYNGDLRDLPQVAVSLEPQIMPEEIIPTFTEAPALDSWIDPLAQTDFGAGQMPDPIMNFEALKIGDGGSWHPPDTQGDVGPNHYIEVVNVAIGIYDKATGAQLLKMPFNTFFQNAPSPCNTANNGDPVVIYDHIADRWIITDFALPSGQSWECFAVSQTGDPVSGGWYFYTIDTENSQGSWCDYPKLGVWPDAYYMTCNMFTPNAGGRVMALDRAKMLAGLPVSTIAFDLGYSYWSLLPAHLKGPLPPAGAPNYLMSFDFPNILRVWKMYVDWTTPANSHLDGPTNMATSPAGYVDDVPQPGVAQVLDTIGDRLMYTAHYRNMGDHESLWVNHTVASGGIAGVRWYEVRDLSATPTLYQEGTYAPGDGHYRWMGSLATDQDGNMALGYSVASTTLYPSIRYTGRMNGEPLGQLPQGETSLVEGTGSQTGTNRWGDYSMMTIDPVDGCTFWYTQMYLHTTGGSWTTQIGSFKFPSCGLPKGWIEGTVYDSTTMAGIAGAPVVAQGPDATLTVETDANGHYAMILPGDTYTLTAGPLLPGYPVAAVVTDVTVTAGSTLTLDIPLGPMPNLAERSATVDDNVAGGNGNGYPEPGESGLLLWNSVTNTGSATATDIGAYVIPLTPGVTMVIDNSTYPDIPAGQTMTNTTPFVFTIAPTVPCGTRLDFEKLLVTAQGSFTVPFSLYAKVPLPRQTFFFDNMEAGAGGWVTGGTQNTWAIRTTYSHSPTHAWSDSLNQYVNNTNSWLRSPILDLTDKPELQITFWHRYSTEVGYDYCYPEYSTDGGVSWAKFGPAYDGSSGGWLQETGLDASVLEGQASAAFRFRLNSDGGVTDDGWFIDDVEVTYEPYECTFDVEAPGVPTLISPANGTVTGTHDIAFTWQAGAGAAPDSYELELDGQVITTTAPSWAATLATGVHTWRVRALNSAGSSNYTAAWTVEIVDAPGIPVLISPPDGTITAAGQVTFTWQAGAGFAPESYDLELDGVVITTAGTSWTATLAPGPHTWRVRAYNVAGYSDYTGAWDLLIAYRVYLPVVTRNP